MKLELMKEEVEVPHGANAEVVDTILKLKGPKGELTRDFKNPRVKIEKKETSIVVSAANATKKEKTIIGTFTAHIKNMMNGVTRGHKYRLKICSGHFPMNVSISGRDFIVKNFLGEKVPRVLKMKEGVNVKIEGQDVIVEGASKEVAGQTAADIEKLTKVRGRDERVFQDGIYITEKDGKDMMK